MQSGTNNVIIHTSVKPENMSGPIIVEKTPRPAAKKHKVGYSERLLRNTAIACALLMGILTLKNVDAPWSQAAVSGIESALTMRLDPDASLGQLSFVRSIIPESTLVFLNITGKSIVEPVEGEVIHEYSAGQPWTVYRTDEGAQVKCAMAGNVSAVMQMDSGDWCMVVDHDGGIETMYAYIEKPNVDAGDAVARGEVVSSVNGGELYYEYRLNGKSVAPGTEADN